MLRLGVLKDQLKWDQPALTVAAGQLVDLVFTNTDVMPHNFILGAPGSLPAIGAAADALMSSPAGQVQQFVPGPAADPGLDPSARTGPVDHHPVPRPRPGRRLSLRLHVPGPLAADERGADRDRRPLV